MEPNDGESAMKILILFISLFVGASFAQAADKKTSSKEMLFSLTQQNIIAIEPSKDISREKFESGMWGLFEVRIPKKLFPIPAPNCRKNVMLRIFGVDPDERDSKQKLEFRWQLFQSLYAVMEGKIDSIEVPLESGPYLKFDKQGNPILEWCNAYIDANSMSKRPFTPPP